MTVEDKGEYRIMEFNKEVYLKNIEAFSNEIGISGHEGQIAKLLHKAFKKNGLVVERDGLGGIYASKKGLSKKTNKKRVLIAAHMDEVGFMAKELLPNGLIKVAPVGGLVPESLFGIRVTYSGKTGVHTGIFTAVPAHFAATNAITANDLSVDFGFETSDEARANGMEEGTAIAFDTQFSKTANPNRFLGKAIDNRYGCAMIATLAETIFSKSFQNKDVEIILAATVMEEIGLKGASAAIEKVQPDFTIVLDCSPASDTLPKDNKNGMLGEGVLYRYLDRTMVLSERLKNYLLIILKENGIKYQPYVSAGGTDAGKMLELLEGIPTITCCIPARYIHNSGAIFDVRDVEEAYKAIWQLAKNYKADIHGYLHYQNEE